MSENLKQNRHINRAKANWTERITSSDTVLRSISFATVMLVMMAIGCSKKTPTESEPATPAAETTSGDPPADQQPLANSPNDDSVEVPDAPVRDTLFIPFMTIANYPGDYVGETFNRQLWIAYFRIQSGGDGTWRLNPQDGAISNRNSAPDLGQYHLDEGRLNFLITEAQAKEIRSFPADRVFNCSVTFTIEKQRIKGRDYFVTVFSRIHRVGQ